MRREPEFFQDQEVELLYIAKKLREAMALEDLLTSANVDYLIETDQYFGGFIFQRVRVGAFFYVPALAAEPARQLMRANGNKPYEVQA
jgi:hypothetical protein